MDQQLIDLGREAIWTAGLILAPVLCVGLVAGLVMGILQTLTQVHDQTVSMVPKILATLATLAVGLPWFVQHLMDYSQQLWSVSPF